ncbi:superoxide dismutase [Thermanaerothrix sp. 4228-RoL]|jgi:Fe-Mn family superoxide dismutase|uniref:Superoxide dismutase n=1 Tax=Thermanaerothrix solaris TaxID=3058434 RepID=A0ABU3NM45_9CHLR|nr:superoxide dismutase [Thermanaerothrix sp. 4228-RoL]MDT8897920.1 superoxide dismutase [Thermanaerothrix sp. 4228-RoL]
MGKPFELPELKYAYAALEPVIDARTMEIHHTKHHAAYVNNLNKALESAPEWFDHPIEEILRRINEIPESIRTAVRNHGGGHANHSLFWEVMIPGGAKEPHGALAEAINATFGSFAAFQEQFSNAAITRFGSGWAWLVVDGDKKLRVYSTPNQDSPYMEGHTPILGLDVWEHAYYLNYQWRRPDYVKAWWSVVNWDVVGRLYEQAR